MQQVNKPESVLLKKTIKRTRNPLETFLETSRPQQLNHHSSHAVSTWCVSVTYLHKVVDGFEVCQVVVGHVHTDAEVEASVAPVNDLEVPELWE